jgi:hypothetical protein
MAQWLDKNTRRAIREQRTAVQICASRQWKKLGLAYRVTRIFVQLLSYCSFSSK